MLHVLPDETSQSKGYKVMLHGLQEISSECQVILHNCYDIKPVRKEEGKSYWKIPLCDDDATREK